MRFKPGSRLFVGGLDPSITADDLMAVFAVHGQVLELPVLRGYAFVQYNTHEEAKHALEAEHGREVKGRALGWCSFPLSPPPPPPPPLCTHPAVVVGVVVVVVVVVVVFVFFLLLLWLLWLLLLLLL